MNDLTQPQQTKGFGWTCSGLLTERDARNLRVFNVFLILWALSFAISLIALGAEVLPSQAGFALPAITLALGGVSVQKYFVFLRGADELLRRIQLEAFAFGFGGGTVLMLTWGLLEELGAPQIQAAGWVSIMLILWGIGQRLGIRRYYS